jgi:outer membrane protein OmpA-like peptidoglycan-associated protein
MSSIMLTKSVAIGRLFVLQLMAAFLVLGCASPQPVALPERPIAPTASVAFDRAIDFAVDDLLIQTQRLPEMHSPLPKDTVSKSRPRIAVDVTLDSTTGQQTAATRLLDERLLERAASRFPQFEVGPLSSTVSNEKRLVSANFLVAATLSPVGQQSLDADARYRINLSMTNLSSGFVVAQASAQTTAVGIDNTPTRFFQESPSLSRDRVIDGQIKTARAESGTEADGVYISNVAVSALIAQGARLYDAGNFSESAKVYEAAANRPDGRNLRVFNGLYLSSLQLGKMSAAEGAFEKLVSLGLSTNRLSIKFLFKAGSVDFLADSKINGAYPMWLRVVAKEINSSRQCVDIVGHSSKTGAEQVNNRLSLARAVAIQKRLEQLTPDLAARLQSTGMGFKETIIGTGTDDLRDALDRRVEFRVRACP